MTRAAAPLMRWPAASYNRTIGFHIASAPGHAPVPQLDPKKQREFAVDVVRRLRARNFEAYWAGGCVRDQLLGRAPKDYDVATTARPEEIRELFGAPHGRRSAPPLA